MNWLPAGLPPWFAAVARAIEARFARARPVDPVRLPMVANPTKLPPASDWAWASMMVQDVDGMGASAPVFSDGTVWRRYDTRGAV